MPKMDHSAYVRNDKVEGAHGIFHCSLRDHIYVGVSTRGFTAKWDGTGRESDFPYCKNDCGMGLEIWGCVGP